MCSIVSQGGPVYVFYSFTGWSCVCSIVSQGVGGPVCVLYSFTGWSCVCCIVSQGGPVSVL